MIDTITIANRWKAAAGDDPWHLEGDRIRTDLPFRPRLGRHAAREWFHAPGVTVRFVPDSMHSWVEVNPTRMAGSANFPLMDIQSVDDIDIDEVGRAVLAAFGFGEYGEGDRAYLHLTRWGVTRVAYTVDVFVGLENVEPILIALVGLKRARQSKAQTWANRQGQTNCVQFGNKNAVRVMFYDKRDELLNRIEPLEARRMGMSPKEKRDLESAANAATGYIRFEVTLVGVPNIRKVFGKRISTEWCPTLQLMTTRAVANHVLRRELDKLGLLRLNFNVARTPPPNEATQRIFAAVREFNMGTSPMSQRATRGSFSYTYAMALAHLYEKQHVLRRRDLEEWWGGTTSSMKRMERDLRALGLPILRRHRGRSDGRLLDFTRALLGARRDLLEGDLPHLEDPPGADGCLTKSDTIREVPAHRQDGDDEADESTCREVSHGLSPAASSSDP